MDEPDGAAAIEQEADRQCREVGLAPGSAHATALRRDRKRPDSVPRRVRGMREPPQHRCPRSPQRLRTAAREISPATRRARAWSAGTACTRRPRRPRKRSCRDSARAGSARHRPAPAARSPASCRCRPRARPRQHASTSASKADHSGVATTAQQAAASISKYFANCDRQARSRPRDDAEVGAVDVVRDAIARVAQTAQLHVPFQDGA